MSDDFDFDSVLADLPDTPCVAAGKMTDKKRKKLIARRVIEGILDRQSITAERIGQECGDKDGRYTNSMFKGRYFKFYSEVDDHEAVRHCQENFRIAMKELSNDEKHEIVKERGLTKEEFVEFVQGLETASID